MLNFKLARIKARMTQQELGDATGITKRTIKNYETGARNMTVPNLIKIANALNVTTDFLLEREVK